MEKSVRIIMFFVKARIFLAVPTAGGYHILAVKTDKI